jgi:hypothetical protein
MKLRTNSQDEEDLELGKAELRNWGKLLIITILQKGYRRATIALQ